MEHLLEVKLNRNGKQKKINNDIKWVWSYKNVSEFKFLDRNWKWAIIQANKFWLRALCCD